MDAEAEARKQIKEAYGTIDEEGEDSEDDVLWEAEARKQIEQAYGTIDEEVEDDSEDDMLWFDQRQNLVRPSRHSLGYGGYTTGMRKWPADRPPPQAGTYAFFETKKHFMLQKRDVYKVVFFSLVGKYYFKYDTIVHAFDYLSAKEAVGTLTRNDGAGLSKEELREGDHIWVYRTTLKKQYGWYQHHGIWAGNNKTIEYSEALAIAIARILRLKPPGEVYEGTFEQFSGNGRDLVFRYPHDYNKYGRKNILDRATNLLGMGAWEPLRGNCEHVSF